MQQTYPLWILREFVRVDGMSEAKGLINLTIRSYAPKGISK
jgi:hypothetical protein